MTAQIRANNLFFRCFHKKKTNESGTMEEIDKKENQLIIYVIYKST